MNEVAYTYIDEHLISPSLICPICLGVLEEPHIHAHCDSAFCRSCLLQLSEPLCPICRSAWNDSVPLSYNIDLPKANRLIRNMLNDLRVRCIHCRIILRRGQLEHECQPNSSNLVKNSSEQILIKIFKSMKLGLSVLGLILTSLFIYQYHAYLFEQAVDRRSQLINNIGYNLDVLLLEIICALMKLIIEYSKMIILINICCWAYMMFHGKYLVSTANEKILNTVLEILIIVGLISYSLSN